MNRNQDILKVVLEEISLKQEEEKELNRKTKELVDKIKPFLKKEKILLGGSLAKRTLIKKEEQDVDIFVVFQDEKSTDNLDLILNKAKIKAKKIHGSRDYFQLKERSRLFEFIPIVKINQQNKNVTDFSPLHVSYINKKANKKLLDEIKLSKAFCMAQRVYGAESYIQGLSGYAIELLLCYYRTFIAFLKGIQKDVFIDLEKQFRNKQEAFREINQSKLSSPMVLIDPTNKYRNVCAGLSNETFQVLKLSARNFLKKPSRDFFKVNEFKEEVFIKQEKQKKLKVYAFFLRTERENKDIAGTKMKKFFNFLIRELEEKQQKVVSSEFVYFNGKKVTAFISTKEKSLIEIRGPKQELTQAVKNFKKARKKIYFSRGFAITKEKFNIKEFFENRRQTAQDMKIKFNWKEV